MRVPVTVVAALAVWVDATLAQAPTGVPAVDSANVARAAWSSAVGAARQNDVNAAFANAERAAAAWPTQQSFVWYSALFAAQLGDSNAVRQALERYARLGLGRDLSDTTFDRYRLAPWFRDLARRHYANRAAIVNSVVRVRLSDSTTWPEGVDFDARSGSFYVTSIRHRTLVEVTRDGRERALWPRDRPGIGAVFAVRVDSRRNVIWATTSATPQMSGYTLADSGLAALLQVRMADGAILKRWDLPATRTHALGDVAVGPGGDVFITDSNEPVLYRLRPGADTLEPLRHPLFRSLQGIATTPHARVIYVADYSHGLLRVDIATSRVTHVDAPADMTTLGCDGIAWYDNSIVAVQNGVVPARIMRFRLDASGQRIVRADVLDRNWRMADEPTIGTIVGDTFVYVANSQWEKYTEDGRRVTERRLTAPTLLALRLRR